MSKDTKLLETPLGSLEFSAEFDTEAVREYSLELATFEPVLPEGMAVDACFCVLLSVPAHQVRTTVVFTANLRPSLPVSAGGETGQGLEAQAWRSAHNILLVGTEDEEWLRARLARGVTLTDVSFDYSPESFSVRIAQMPSGESLSLHFIVAWNKLPEPKDCSCWYAVDVSRQVVIVSMETGHEDARRPSSLNVR